jgi:hypothetical protein
MLGKSGKYYRAGHLARQANDWPDATNGQEEDLDDAPMQATPSSSLLGQQDSPAVPAVQQDVPQNSPQFSDAFSFTPSQMSAFAPLERSQKTENALQPNAQGQQMDTDLTRASTAPVPTSRNMYNSRDQQWPATFGMPESFNSEDSRRWFNTSLPLSNNTFSFRPSSVGRPVNENLEQWPQDNYFVRPLPSSSPTLSFLGAPGPQTFQQPNLSDGFSTSAYDSSFAGSNDSKHDLLASLPAPSAVFSMSGEEHPIQQARTIQAQQGVPSVTGNSRLSASSSGAKNGIQTSSPHVGSQTQLKPLTASSLAAIERSGMRPEQKIAFRNAVIAAADRHGLDPNLLVGLAQRESRLNPTISPDHQARGLFQIRHPRQQDLGVSDATINSVDDIVEPVADYLSKSLRTFGGNTDLTIGSWNRGVRGMSKINNNEGMPGVRNTVIFANPKKHSQDLLGRDYIDKVKAFSR